MKTDLADLHSLVDTLDGCIDPLEYASQPDGALMNIATGQIAHPGVNAGNAVNLGHRAIENVKGGWSDSLYCPLGKLVVTMDVTKNHVLVDKERVYERELIYARVIGLLASSREINFNDMLAIELAAYEPSMLNADEKMNGATSKSTLKHKLQVIISELNWPISDTMIGLCDVSTSLGYHLQSGKLPCLSTWTPLRRSSIKLYDAQMSSSCLTGRPTSLTAPRPSR